MKKLLAAALLYTLAFVTACAPAHAGPNDLVINQRNSIDNGIIIRTMASPAADGMLYYNASTLLPSYATLGPGLTITNGVLNTTPQAAQVNADWSAASGVAQILNKPALKTVALTGQAGDLTGLAPVALSGAYADLTGRPAAALPRVFGYRVPALNTCFQLSTSRDVQASYVVDVTTTLTLIGGARGSVYMRSYADSTCSTGQVELVSGSSGLPAALSVAIGLQNLGSVALQSVVPAGAWVRIETANDTGTPTFAARRGQEVQL